VNVRREIEIEGAPEEVWEALVTEEGRERWLEPGAPSEVHVEVVDEPSRLVWWWWEGDEPATRVEINLVPAVSSTRVVVTESVPSFPLATLAAAFARPSRAASDARPRTAAAFAGVAA
jgi:uncharacterized protein YndB with AHSA1/START domain